MIKELARCVREYKWAAILGPVCMIGEVYMETRIPLVLSRIVDEGVSVGTMSAVVSNGSVLVLYALASLLFGIASAVLASYAPPGFPGTCATICIIRCRNLTLPTSTNSPHRPSSPV